ncbi:hypothetical protein ACFX1R_039676 [Malus domestica]
MSVHSRLGPRTSIHSWLRSHSDSQHEQSSRQSFHSRLSPQEASSIPHRSMQHDGRREAITQSSSSSIGSLRRTRLPARDAHTHRIRGIDEPNTWKSSLNQQVEAVGSREIRYPNKRKFKKK